jgi:hypothetical protein
MDWLPDYKHMQQADRLLHMRPAHHQGKEWTLYLTTVWACKAGWQTVLYAPSPSPGERMDLIPGYELVRHSGRLFICVQPIKIEGMDWLPGNKEVVQAGRLLREHPAQHQDQEWTSYLAIRRWDRLVDCCVSTQPSTRTRSGLATWQ